MGRSSRYKDDDRDGETGISIPYYLDEFSRWSTSVTSIKATIEKSCKDGILLAKAKPPSSSFAKNTSLSYSQTKFTKPTYINVKHTHTSFKKVMQQTQSPRLQRHLGWMWLLTDIIALIYKATESSSWNGLVDKWPYPSKTYRGVLAWWGLLWWCDVGYQAGMSSADTTF